MFVDEMTIHAKAGNGGTGVVRWLRERSRPLGGPAGGNGGRGGSIYFRTVRDNNILARYTGSKEFKAGNGEAGLSRSKHGKDGADLYIDVPVGSVITNLENGRTFELFEPDTTVKALKGGTGGLGNEHFKSSTNRTPEEHTPGRDGEEADFKIEVELVVDVGIIGEPNAGKSTLLNSITRATSRVADYPFTTLEPHLGDLFGYTLADIPGLIEGASSGKGLGHKFLRHVRRTRMLAHCVSLEEADPRAAYARVRTELGHFDTGILDKEEWVILTKADAVRAEEADAAAELFKKEGRTVYVISKDDDASLKRLADDLVRHLREGERKEDAPAS
jgi:GTPase